MELDWAPKGPTETVDRYLKTLPSESLPVKGSQAAQDRKQLLQKQIPIHDIDPTLCHELTESELAQMQEYIKHMKGSAGVGQVVQFGGINFADTHIIGEANAQYLSNRYPKGVSSIETVQLQGEKKITALGKQMEKMDLQLGMVENKTDYCTRELSRARISEEKPFQNKNYINEINRNVSVPHYAHRGHIVLNDTQTPYSIGNLRDLAYSTHNPNLDLANSNLPQLISYNPKTIHLPQEEILTHSNLPPIKSYSPMNQHCLANDKKLPSKFAPLPAYNPETIKLPEGELLQSSNFLLTQAKELLVNAKLSESSVLPNLNYSSGQFYNPKEELLVNRSADSNFLPNAMRITDSGKPPNLNDSSHQLQTNILGGNIKPNLNYSSVQFHDPVEESLLNTASSLNLPQNTMRVTESRKTANLNNWPLQSFNPNSMHVLEDELVPSKIAVGAIKDLNYDNIEIKHALQQDNKMFSEMPFVPIEQLPPQSQKCRKCDKPFKPQEFAIFVEKSNALYHSACFKCAGCNTNLADLLYFYDKEMDEVYCGRDFAKIRGIPRCQACDELIFLKEYCLAENCTFHLKHFCCFECDEALAGKNYVVEDFQPVCVACYEKVKAQKCFKCLKVIRPDEEGVSLTDKVHFHTYEECFCCAVCQKGLKGGKLLFKNEILYCSPDCFKRNV